MTTGLDIVTKALQKNGVLVKSETPSADEANDGLYALNALVSSLANESLMIYANTQESFPLVAGINEYTIGSGQTFNTTRPMFISDAYIRKDVTDYKLISLTDDAYAGISNKSTQGLPTHYNYFTTYPAAKIRLHVTPSEAYTLFLVSEKEITSFTLAGDVALPNGWERFLIHQLGYELGPDYGEAVNDKSLAMCKSIADDAKKAIMTNTLRNRSFDWPNNNPVGINSLLNRGY